MTPRIAICTALAVLLLTAGGCASSNKEQAARSAPPPPMPPPPQVQSAANEPFAVTPQVVQQALQSAVEAYESMRKKAGRGASGTPWPKLRSIDGLVGARLIKYVPPPPPGKRWHLDTLSQRVELKDEL